MKKPRSRGSEAGGRRLPGSVVAVEGDAGDGIDGLGGVVLEAGAIAHFGVEHLTGGEGFLLRKRLRDDVRFYQVDDVERHQVGGTPRHICVGVGEDSRRSTVFRRLRSKNLAVFLENRLRLGESYRGAGVG